MVHDSICVAIVILGSRN